MTDVKSSFGGSMPEHYDRHLGPAQFGPFAAFLAGRLPVRPPGDVLEIACGTGLVTRRLRERLDAGVRLVASDLAPPSPGCRTTRSCSASWTAISMWPTRCPVACCSPPGWPTVSG